MRIPDKIARNAKAYAGAVGAVGAVGTATVEVLQDGVVTTDEVATLVGFVAAAVAAVGAIWGVRNREDKPTDG